MPDHPTPACAAGDAALIDQTLEIAATRCTDLTPAVFARFFERCPEATALFTVIDPNTPPMGCGQMLFEVISLLTDTANGQPYVASYMHQIACDHVEFKVDDARLYQAFMAALVDVIAGLLDANWTEAHAQAWARQCQALLGHLPTALAPAGQQAVPAAQARAPGTCPHTSPPPA